MRSHALLFTSLGLSLAYGATFLYTRSVVDGVINALEAREAKLDGVLELRSEELELELAARDEYDRPLSYGYMKRDAHAEAAALYDEAKDALVLEIVRRANKPAPKKLEPPKPGQSKPGQKAGSTPEQYDPSKDPKRDARDKNAQQKDCKSSNDCTQYCRDQLKLPSNKAPMSTCDMSGNRQGQGVCKCADGTQVADLVAEGLKGVAEVACNVWNKATEIGIDIATSVIPGGMAASAAEKAAVQAIKGLLKGGNKSGLIDFCGGKGKALEKERKEKEQKGKGKGKGK